MARPKKTVIDPAFLSAALEGLELQRKRIDEQIQYVKSLLGAKKPRPSGRSAGGGQARRETGTKRRRSQANRKSPEETMGRVSQGQSSGGKGRRLSRSAIPTKAVDDLSHGPSPTKRPFSKKTALCASASAKVSRA